MDKSMARLHSAGPDLLVRLRQDPALAYVLIFTLMGVFAYLPLLLTLAEGMAEPGITMNVANRDFVNYWMGARLTLAGQHLDLFSQPLYFAHLREVFGPNYPIHNWAYPPHFLLLLMPLGVLEYKPAMVVFLAATLLLFVASTIVFRRTYAPRSDAGLLVMAGTGFVFMMLDTTQNGFLTAAALLLGLAWMKDRPLLAGVAFAILTIKPQLGFLVPVLLVVDRNWRALLWTSIFSAAFATLSVYVLGQESWYAYATETVPYQRSVMTDWYGIFLRMMPTTFGSLRTLGFSPETAWLIQLPVTILSTALVVWLLLRETDLVRKAFVLTAGTLLISPYAFNYDMGALTVTGAVLLGTRQIASRQLLLAVAICATLAPLVMNMGRAGVPVAPVVFASVVIGMTVSVIRTRGAIAQVGAPMP